MNITLSREELFGEKRADGSPQESKNHPAERDAVTLKRHAFDLRTECHVVARWICDCYFEDW